MLALDGNWLLHRAFHAVSRYSTNLEKRIASVLISQISKYALKFKAKHILVAFDGPKVFRYEIYPEYKANRKGEVDTEVDISECTLQDPVYANLPFLFAELDKYGIRYLQLDKYEADDLLATVSAYCTSKKVQLTLVAKDKDAFQNLSPYVKIYTPGSKPEDDKILDEAWLVANKGYTPKQFQLLQVLTGDPIDNVKPLVDKTRANKIVKKYTLEEVHDKLLKTELAESFKLNKALVCLATNAFEVSIDSLAFKPQKKLSKPDAYLQLVAFTSKRALF